MKNVFRYAVSVLLVMNLGSVVHASSENESLSKRELFEKFGFLKGEAQKLKKARYNDESTPSAITNQELAQWLAIVSKKQQKQDEKIKQQRRTIAKQSRTINYLMNSSHTNCAITDERINDLDGRMSDQEDFAERSVIRADKIEKVVGQTFEIVDKNINALDVQGGNLERRCGVRRAVMVIESQLSSASSSSSSSAAALKNQSDSESHN